MPEMITFIANISLGTGAIIRVYIQAPDLYTAQQMLKAQYGAQLVSNAIPYAPN
jgi:hypothetical protein